MAYNPAQEQKLPSNTSVFRRDVILLALLIGWASFPLVKGAFIPGSWVGKDYAITLTQSISVVRYHSYPIDFTYPLPSVLFRYYLGEMGPHLGGLIWVFGIAFSLFFTFRYLAEEFCTGPAGWKYVCLILSFIPVAYYTQWDIKMLNCNHITLCFVLLSTFYEKRKRSFMSGLFLSLGIAWKLYPVVIIPYLLITKRFRLLLSLLFWIAILFAVIPLAVLGSPLFGELTGQWVRCIASTRADDFFTHVMHIHAYKMSLHYSILHWLSHGALPALSTHTLHNVKLMISLLQVLLVIFGTVYIVFDTRVRSMPEYIDRYLYNTILFLLASLLFSAHLQPHHGVVLIASSMFITNFALYGSFHKCSRTLIFVAALIPAVVLKAASSGVEKAFAMNLQIIVHILLLIFLRFYIARQAQPHSKGFASNKKDAFA